MNRFLKAFLAAVLMLFVGAIMSYGADTAPEGIRGEVFDALNALREEHHAEPLKYDEQLESAAQHQAEYLARIGKLEKRGPAGEDLKERARDAGYGGDRTFTITETNAQVWVDTDVDHLVSEVWSKNQASLQAIFNSSVRQIGIGYADAQDKHRYYVLTLAGMDDGRDDYNVLPTYDYRTPKPTISATPTTPPMMTSTANPDGSVIHPVREGETFSEIAVAYDVDYWSLSVLNHLPLSDTTPVVIYEGQDLVIHPSFTPTPTPTETRTPVPPTVTPRPTFTGGPEAAPTTAAELTKLPPPRWDMLLARLAVHQRTAGWILVALSAAGLILVLRKRK